MAYCLKELIATALTTPKVGAFCFTRFRRVLNKIILKEFQYYHLFELSGTGLSR